MSFFAINLIFRYCNDEALEADDNTIKAVNLCVKSLSDYREFLDKFVFN